MPLPQLFESNRKFEADRFDLPLKDFETLKSQYLREIGRSEKLCMVDLSPTMERVPGVPSYYYNPWEKAERYSEMSKVFDELCSLKSPSKGKDLQLLYKGQEINDRSKNALLKETDKDNENGDANPASRQFPTGCLLKVCGYLDHLSILRCRQVSKLWNKLISSSPPFLSRTRFVISQSLDLIQRCKVTQVKWRHIKCHLLPCPESTYHQKYLVSRLHQGAINNTNTKTLNSINSNSSNLSVFQNTWLHSISLKKVEIQKESLIKWLISCPRLTQLKFTKCSFPKSKISWTKETLSKVTDKLTTIRAIDLTISDLNELGRLILLLANNLKTLELKAKGLGPKIQGKDPQIQGLKRKALEQEVVTLITSTLAGNWKSLKNLQISLEPFVFGEILVSFFKKIGTIGMNLEEFEFVVENQGPILDPFLVGIQEKDVESTVSDVLKTSKKLKKLKVPFLKIDFQDIQKKKGLLPLGLSKTPGTLSDLGAQLDLTQVKDEKMRLFPIRKEFTLKKLSLYSPTDYKTVFKCFPWLKELKIETSECDIRDEDLQQIIKTFKKLNSLSLKMVGLSDIGVMGTEPEMMRKMKENYLRKMGNREVGFPLKALTMLEVFRCEGDMNLTDIGIINGMAIPGLKILELVGSPLNLSETSLDFLSLNCPKLKSISLDLSCSTCDQGVVDGFLKNLRLNAGGGRILLK